MLCVGDTMDEQKIIEALKDKDDKKAYELAKKISAESAETDKYYKLFDRFIGMLDDKSSYVRTRGFCLACSQAKWDSEGKIAAAFDIMSELLYDPKPTVVRQCLKALHEVALFRIELTDIIYESVKAIDQSVYKDSISPLIKHDVDELLKFLE